MLQLASATATLVSGGQRFKPRLVREVEDVITGKRSAWPVTRWSPCRLKAEHVEVIRKALHGVTQEGTSTRVFARRALCQRRQDRHGAGRGRAPEREVQRLQARRAPARPLAVHRRRADRSAHGGAGGGGGKRRLRRRQLRRRSRGVCSTTCCRAVPERRGHRAHARGQELGADGQAAAVHADVPLPCQAALPPVAAASAPAAPAAAASAPQRVPARRAVAAAAMNAVFEQPSPWLRLRRVFGGFDGPLLLAVAASWPRSASWPCIRPATTMARASSTTAATC